MHRYWIPALVVLSGGAALRAAEALRVSATANTGKMMPYQVFELTFQHDGKYRDPTWDVAIDVEFVSPRGETYRVGGFFFGSSRPQRPILRDPGAKDGGTALWPCDPADLWKARFAPKGLGRWTFRWSWQDVRGGRASGSGQVLVVQGRVHQKGFVRIDPHNPFRLLFDDGTPFWPIGFQDCIGDGNHNGSVLDSMMMEGPFRPDPERRRPQPPPGPLFARGPAMGPVNADVDFGRHARAGFNLWRFSPNNCSIKLFARPENPNAGSLDHVRWEQARMVDELLQTTRKYGIRNYYGLFGYHQVFSEHPEDEQGMRKVKRLVKYSVDRWGAYVDFWEFLNEQKADTRWYEMMIPYLRSIDPYQHPIATSWERPEIDGIQINAPHWYGNENELASDAVTAERARRDKRFNKPVIYGEQGNSRGNRDRTAEGIGGVWDPGSARRMRVRLWTAMFSEVALVFWETSYAKDGHHMNLWIGPEERQYVHALQDFAALVDRTVRPAGVHLEGPLAREVRAYGLKGEKSGGAYLHHFGCADCTRLSATGAQPTHRWDHDRGDVTGLKLTVDVPEGARAYWYRPTDAAILARLDVPAGRHTFPVPAFSVDLALVLTDRGPPDSDHDGTPNDEDQDDDNDGLPDSKDAFPLEREEQFDADQDRIGDNLDADLDGDGVGEDRNGNGIADCEENDWDGDGVPQAGTIPWDAFPHDPNQWRDTDGDGIGDKADPDDDGDGYSDQQEKAAGTNPLDPLSFP